MRTLSAASILLGCAFSLHAQVNVITYQYDNTRAGVNSQETILNKANVNTNSFGKLFTYSVDGSIYGQPLYMANVAIPGAGTHNVVYVATSNDSVYAFDADSGAYGGPLWQVSFLNSGDTPVPANNVNCGQVAPKIGITSTPVIDIASGTIYVVAMTLEGQSYVQRLHALDITTGAERTGSPVTIQATYPGRGEGGSTLVFNPRNYKQRPGLLLLNGVVYTAWSSHCDIGAYHGWLIGYDANTLKQVSVYNNTANGNQGSFWSGGAAPAVDSGGNIYLSAGNGTFDYAQGGPDLGESYIKLSTSNGLAVADYFTPFNYGGLNSGDLDIGSAGVALIGDEAGSAAHPHLMTGAGKEGRIYLLDRDNMGKLSATDSAAVQTIPGGLKALFGNPAYFNHSIYFCGAGNDLMAFSVSNAQMSTTATSQSAEQFGYPDCVPTISSNGNSNAILWALEPAGDLWAYDASDLTKVLYSATQNADRDVAGNTVEFSVPTVANGKVYAGRDSVLAVYGLLSAGDAGLPVANSASGDVGELAPGSLATIYGSGLATSTATASGFPIPLSLGGASVTVGGVSAPILYASSGQLNIQIPFEVPPGNAVVSVSVGGNVVESGSFNILSAAPGVFASGGAAAVVNQNGSINSFGNPAATGSTISLYVTGLGAVSPSVATGQAATYVPLSWTVSPVTATIGSTPATVGFAGLAPGFAGLYQMNIVLPAMSPGQYAVKISEGGNVSNVATVAVQ